jgi:hypothetical protein
MRLPSHMVRLQSLENLALEQGNQGNAMPRVAVS